MASKKTLNAANLEALGAARLAELLLEISEGDAAAKRRLRLELVGAESTGELGKEIRKRLATIERSRGFIDWQHRKALIDDLETQRKLIAEQVAKRDPAEAFELTWRFLEIANSVLNRCEDGGDTVMPVFDLALRDLGTLAPAHRPDPEQLAGRVQRALADNQFGQFDNLIPTLKDVLGPAGLEHLKAGIVALSREPVAQPAGKDRKIVGYSSRGPIFQDEMESRRRASFVRLALQDIADATGDADGFIAQYDEQARKSPMIAAEIAKRLVAANRADEALAALDNAEPRNRFDTKWDEARIDTLDALGRKDAAQQHRWACFERFLSPHYLREYVKRMPDFEDFEAEQRGIGFVMASKDWCHALAFLIEWPALDRAAALVTARTAELDGNSYELLTAAAEALTARYPLAASLTLRAMIDYTLKNAKTSRYGHGARHLAACAALAPRVADWGGAETHDAYAERLKREHGRKAGFWGKVS